MNDFCRNKQKAEIFTFWISSCSSVKNGAYRRFVKFSDYERLMAKYKALVEQKNEPPRAK